MKEALGFITGNELIDSGALSCYIASFMSMTSGSVIA